MRMKEVCARTGLTDRAVRLYIESGLVHPACERSYTGRASFSFAEADVVVLAEVAELRRAGFAIADIARMQADPGCIPEIILARRADLRTEIARREATLDTLERLDPAAVLSCADLAAGLRATAPSNTIPKEDNSMTMKEIKRILRVRLAAVLALVAAVVGIVNLARLTYAGCFVDLTLQPGGGYDRRIDYGKHAIGEVLLAWLPVLLVTAGAVLLFCHIARGKRRLLASAVGCILVGAVLTFALPARIAEHILREAFLGWRYSFLFNIYWSSSEAFLQFIGLLKLVPFALSLGCGIWVLVRHRED